jgi:hypothetical protein
MRATRGGSNHGGNTRGAPPRCGVVASSGRASGRTAEAGNQDDRRTLPVHLRQFGSVDFGAPAGVFLGHRAAYGRWHGALTFHRFSTLAEAVRFVVEELPRGGFAAYIETDGRDLEEAAIRGLYRSKAYPLKRRSDDGAGT